MAHEAKLTAAIEGLLKVLRAASDVAGTSSQTTSSSTAVSEEPVVVSEEPIAVDASPPQDEDDPYPDPNDEKHNASESTTQPTERAEAQRALALAIETQLKDKIKRLLSSRHASYYVSYKYDRSGATPLHWALYMGDVETAETILTKFHSVCNISALETRYSSYVHENVMVHALHYIFTDFSPSIFPETMPGRPSLLAKRYLGKLIIDAMSNEELIHMIETCPPLNSSPAYAMILPRVAAMMDLGQYALKLWRSDMDYSTFKRIVAYANNSSSRPSLKDCFKLLKCAGQDEETGRHALHLFLALCRNGADLSDV